MRAATPYTVAKRRQVAAIGAASPDSSIRSTSTFCSA